MDVKSAVALINRMVYRPGWSFEAEDFTRRFEGTVKVTIRYHTIQTNRENAPEYKDEIDTYASFAFVTLDADRTEIFGRVLDALNSIDEHEARETLRDPDSLDAPFHPHRIAGMKAWDDREHPAKKFLEDLQFGIA
jgi:hypothetical protein